jgi:hypothetical protein
LEGKIHFIPEELEELERLFDHVKILQAEWQVRPHGQVGLFFLTNDGEIIFKFSNLVDQMNPASNQQSIY